MLTVWGLRTCDTCRKAVKWLEGEEIPHKVMDLRADGVPAAELDRWIGALGWEPLLNKSSTTWRNLDAADRDGLDANRARGLLTDHPTLIKRPVFVLGDRVIVGFRDDQKRALKAAA